MIIFNGVSIESVGNVRIEDIKVSPISYNPVVRPRAVQFGSEFVRMCGGERKINITFAIQDMDKINRYESIMNISKWARTDKEYKLELPIEPNKYLECVCTSKPEPSTRQWWEGKLRLTFTCFSNPYWTSKTEKSAQCGAQFTVLGDAPPFMRILRTNLNPVYNQTFSNGTESMTFSTVPAGNMEIDLNRQTAIVGLYSIMNYYNPSGSFLIPRNGIQTINGTGTVRYRERWE